LAAADPVQVDRRPSIELAHGYRKADTSAGARPRDRETVGFRIPSPLGSTKTQADSEDADGEHHNQPTR
jgi:hypothetical protein